MIWLLKWALKANRAFSPFVLGVGTLLQFVWMIALAVGVILGIWDGLVWLFKADWRTTDFQGVFWAAVVGKPFWHSGWCVVFVRTAENPSRFTIGCWHSWI